MMSLGRPHLERQLRRVLCEDVSAECQNLLQISSRTPPGRRKKFHSGKKEYLYRESHRCHRVVALALLTWSLKTEISSIQVSIFVSCCLVVVLSESLTWKWDATCV